MSEKQQGERLELVVRGDESGKAVAHACATCRFVMTPFEVDTQCFRCRKSHDCKECGKPTNHRSHTVCETCRRKAAEDKRAAAEAKAFNAARKVAAKDYDVDHVCTDLWPDEDDYTFVDEVDEELPWVWGCTPMPWPVPAMEDIMIDALTDEFPEEASYSLTNLDELQELVDKWFAEKGPTGFYMIDTSVVVVLDPANTPEKLEVPGDA